MMKGGGISADGSRWVSCRSRFFLPVRVLSRLFRRQCLQMLSAAHAAGRLKFQGDRALRGDAFDPSQNPEAPGTPRPLGSLASAAKGPVQSFGAIGFNLSRSQFAILPKLGRSVCPVPFVTAARHTFA
jgi:Putative transposase